MTAKFNVLEKSITGRKRYALNMNKYVKNVMKNMRVQ